MSSAHYAITAYVIGLGLMICYGLVLWRQSRAMRRRSRGGDRR